MQIVIDIDDKVYGLLKYFEEGLGLNNKKDDNDDVKTALMRAVINGTPLTNILDKIKSEIYIARFIDKDTKICKNANASGLEVAMQIIDKYKAESEDRE